MIILQKNVNAIKGTMEIIANLVCLIANRKIQIVQVMIKEYVCPQDSVLANKDFTVNNAKINYSIVRMKIIPAL